MTTFMQIAGFALLGMGALMFAIAWGNRHTSTSECLWALYGISALYFIAAGVFLK